MSNEQSKSITKTLSVASSDVLKELVAKEKLPADGLWVYMSVEVPDTAGDIVKIAGVSWKSYHNPPNTYLKVTAQHAMELESGTPPVIGRVEYLTTTTAVVNSKSVPALAAYITWAKDAEGNLTDLAKKYADLYASKYMESFSIGFLSDDYQMNESGGLTYNTAILYHLGAVTIPANPYATVLRSLEVSKLETQIKDLQTTLGGMSAILKEIQVAVGTVTVEGLVKDLSNNIQKSVETITDRLDTMEAMAVTKSNTQSKTSNHTATDITPLQDISKTLKRYSGRQD